MTGLLQGEKKPKTPNPKKTKQNKKPWLLHGGVTWLEEVVSFAAHIWELSLWIDLSDTLEPLHGQAKVYEAVMKTEARENKACEPVKPPALLTVA